MSINVITSTLTESRAFVTTVIRAYVTQYPDKHFKGVRVFLPALWLADTLFTALFVTAGGTELEGNPLMRWVMESFGVASFVAVKLLLLAHWLTLANRIRWEIHALLSGFLFLVVCVSIRVLLNL